MSEHFTCTDRNVLSYRHTTVFKTKMKKKLKQMKSNKQSK